MQIQSKKIIRDKQGYYIMIKCKLIRHVLNNRANYVKTHELQGERKMNIIVGNFNITLSFQY